MDYIKEMHELCETLSNELADINRKIRDAGGKMSAGDLEVVDKLTHSIKSIKAVIKMLDEDDGYSGYYPMMDRGSYRGGRSYARRRDGMGRYSRNDLVDRMREMMADTPDERTRQEMMRMIDRMENA